MSALTPREPRERYTQNSKTPFFNKLPAEIRKAVYDLLLVKSDSINVESKGRFGREPPLLMTCRQARHETIKLYYGQNKFNVQVADYDVAPYARFLHHHHLFGYPEKLTLTYAGKPNWANLLHWCRLVYRKRCIAPPAKKGREVDASGNDAVIEQMFAHVEIMSPMSSWETLYNMLSLQRKMLACMDKRWDNVWSMGE